MNDIEKYILDLNWSKPESVQKNAIKELSKIDENQVILLAQQSDLCHKACWHNASIVLKSIGYPRNKLALPYLMNWFQDANWPGVQNIVQLFKEIDVIVLLPHIKNAMKQALRENDETWAYGIVYLIQELGFQSLGLDEGEIYKSLKKIADIE
ncbi:MAG: hypothetical protein K0R93_2044 [Anaerosolibacter sp.]|jgi:hypothetical protein|uniref:DUF5071 domain-containing protein n=1 Tax=Anaerosolibacter sp. TaxID=1872527 RepID=UPI002616F897|nr:DUF5071 domain-containing protein [Anaerosolibacter sp.]MDF2547146.1 hypothetical protein [Anaerosolibacter sp.]